MRKWGMRYLILLLLSSCSINTDQWNSQAMFASIYLGCVNQIDEKEARVKFLSYKPETLSQNQKHELAKMIVQSEVFECMTKKY